MTIEDQATDRKTTRLTERLALHGLEYAIPAVATRLPYFLGAMALTAIVVLAALRHVGQPVC